MRIVLYPKIWHMKIISKTPPICKFREIQPDRHSTLCANRQNDEHMSFPAINNYPLSDSDGENYSPSTIMEKFLELGGLACSIEVTAFTAIKTENGYCHAE